MKYQGRRCDRCFVHYRGDGKSVILQPFNTPLLYLHTFLGEEIDLCEDCLTDFFTFMANKKEDQ